MGNDTKPQLRTPEATRDKSGRIPKGVSGNPGGQSKAKRDFLERMRTDDAEEIYAAIMDGVRAREWSVVLKAGEWLLGKPAAAKEDGEALVKAIGAWPLSRDEMLKIAKGEEP